MTSLLKKREKDEEEESHRPLFLDRKIDEVTTGLAPASSRLLHTISIQNAIAIVYYVLSMKVELNLSDHYRKDIIDFLVKFSKYSDNKSFKSIARTMDTIRSTMTLIVIE
jgi:hypothetical protein